MRGLPLLVSCIPLPWQRDAQPLSWKGPPSAGLKATLPCQHKNRKCSNVRMGKVWGCSQLAEVRIQEGESLENALRRFKRKVQQEDIIKEVKRHSFYLKPGEKKRAKQALARKRNRKKSRREME